MRTYFLTGIFDLLYLSVSLEDVSCIYLILHIIETGVISVCDDRLAFLFEFVQIIYNQGTEEGVSVLQSWLINNHRSTLGFDSFHNALDG